MKNSTPLPLRSRRLWFALVLSAPLVFPFNGRAAAPAALPAQPVEIIRDTFGVPHIFAANLADAVYGQEMTGIDVVAMNQLRQLQEALGSAPGDLAGAPRPAANATTPVPTSRAGPPTGGRCGRDAPPMVRSSWSPIRTSPGTAQRKGTKCISSWATAGLTA